MTEHERVEVRTLPTCDLCETVARYDAKTRTGPWAFLCAQHFRLYGIGLGLGRGQELIVREVSDEAARR